MQKKIIVVVAPVGANIAPPSVNRVSAVGMGASAHAPGQAARTNADLVAQVVRLVRAMGGDVATPEAARQLLGVSMLRWPVPPVLPSSGRPRSSDARGECFWR